MENTYVMCGRIIPEGTIVCPICSDNVLNKQETNLIETVVNIDTVDKVIEFCNLCSKCAGEVSVYEGRYIVAGKSIMGLFSLDLTKPLKVEFYGDIPYEVKEGMKKFIVN